MTSSLCVQVDVAGDVIYFNKDRSIVGALNRANVPRYILTKLNQRGQIFVDYELHADGEISFTDVSDDEWTPTRQDTRF